MKQILPIIILFVGLNIFSQTEYEKGYVIKTNGDKIEGLILNKDWLYAPNEIIFKPNLESETITIDEKDIQKIVIENKLVFDRFTVDIQRYSNNLNNLDDSRVTDFKKESLLLELLVEGEVSLYKYYSGDVEYFFYQKENKIYPLEYKVYKTENNTIGKNLNYKKILRDELKCSAEKLSYDLDYNEKQLIRIFKEYHDCQNFKYKIYRNKKDKGKFNLRAKFGVGFSKVTPPITTTNNSNNKKTIFKFGAEFEYVFPFNNNKWSLFLESSYHSFDAQNSIITGYTVIPSSGAIVPIYKDYGIKYNSIENHLGVRHYMFLNNKNKIFMNTGLLYDLILNSKNDFTNADSTSTVSYFFGAGYDFKNKFSLEVRYNSTRDLSRFSPFTTNYNNVSLKFGYNFL